MLIHILHGPPESSGGRQPLRPRAGVTRIASLVLALLSALAALQAETRTLPPANIRYFEIEDTQWLFIDGKFTFDQALKLPISTAVTDPYGTGWLLAPMLRPADFVNAAKVIKMAQGDLRDRRGPFIGVVQAQGAVEPAGGFFNLDGSVPFVTWGKNDPNDGARVHRNVLREQGFHDALANVSQALLNYYAGTGTSDQFKPTLDFILNEISRPEGGHLKDDVVALYHEKDGSVVAADVYVGSQYPILLSRRKPVVPPSWGPLPTWPKVDGKTALFDGIKVSRRSRITWRWTGGARLGSVQMVNLRTGKTEIDRPRASTANQDLRVFRPGRYLLRLRNISRFEDPWLEITIVVR